VPLSPDALSCVPRSDAVHAASTHVMIDATSATFVYSRMRDVVLAIT
jgi:hypothetical protein